jgi:hypothetical protein
VKRIIGLGMLEETSWEFVEE